MLRLLTGVQIAYLGLFLAVCAAILGWQAYYVWPAEHCESQGGWWSEKFRECGQPISVTQFTGRKLGSPPLHPPPAHP